MAYEDLINTYAQPAINIWGGIQGMQNANNTNSQVQGMLGQNQAATGGAIASLQQQIAQSQAAARQQYEAAQGQVNTQNAALGSQADSLAQQLQALSDPNSAYMQNARQAIERKDAAAGRRSQWGEREVQLQGTLADYVGKYAPGLNNSITGARNQINQNNQGLASIFQSANSVPDRNMMSLVQLLQNQLQGANAANTTGRAAANSASNNLTGLLSTGAKTLGSLFGQYGTGGGGGINDYYGPSISQGITGYTPDFGGGSLGGGYDLGSSYGGWGGDSSYYGAGMDPWGASGGGSFDYGSGGIMDNSLWE